MIYRFFNKKTSGNQKAIMIALLAVASVLVILVAVDMFLPQKKDDAPQLSERVPVQEIEEDREVVDYDDIINMPEQDRDVFREEVPVNIIVPEVDTELSEEQKREIALPTVVVPASSGSESKFRNFEIMADNNEFIPLRVIANVGDVININFTAVDKEYDIVFPSYNMMQKAQAGQTRMLQFQALQEGSFSYYCSLCGGPESGPRGNIVIVQP